MILENFSPYRGIHCETTTIGNLLKHQGLIISEPLLFGIGEGFDFCYHLPEALQLPFPMISGRSLSGDILNKIQANCNIKTTIRETEESEQAFLHIKDALSQGNAVGLKLDLFYLDYFKKRFHFPIHFVTLYGYDKKMAYVVDSEIYGMCQSISLENLAKSMASQIGLTPSKNLSFTLEIKEKELPLQSILPKAIQNNAKHYLTPRGKYLGYEGLLYTAQDVKKWLDNLSESMIKIQIIVDLFEIAGTGGANYRAMYYNFLKESKQFIRSTALDKGLQYFEELVQMWDRFGKLLRYGAANLHKQSMTDASEVLTWIASLEKKAMSLLADI